MPRKKTTRIIGGGGGRREEIIRAAAKLFREKGYNGTSIVEIAREVGLPKGSIYNYVESKEELLYDIITFGIRTSLPRFKAIAASNENPENKFRQIVYEDTLSMMKYHDFITVFYQDRNNLSGKHSKEYITYRAEVEGCFRKILEEGIAEGVFRETNVTLLIFAVLGMCNWITQWYKSTGKLSPEKIATFFSETAMLLVCS